jgi:hypothetical protein
VTVTDLPNPRSAVFEACAVSPHTDERLARQVAAAFLPFIIVGIGLSLSAKLTQHLVKARDPRGLIPLLELEQVLQFAYKFVSMRLTHGLNRFQVF